MKPTAKPKKAKTVTFKPKQDREKEKRHQRISAKVAAYEGVELEAGEDDTKGKVIGAELRRPHSGIRHFNRNTTDGLMGRLCYRYPRANA